MDHLYAVHQCWQGVLDGLWGTIIERLDELLEGGQVLNIILCLVKGLGNSELDASPLRSCKIDLVTGLSE